MLTVRRTLKGGIVDEEGNNVELALVNHSQNSKSPNSSPHPETTPPPKRASNSRLSVSDRYKHIAT